MKKPSFYAKGAKGASKNKAKAHPFTKKDAGKTGRSGSTKRERRLEKETL